MNKKRIMKWIGLAVMLSMAPFVRATVDNNNPIANSKAVVICGNARFTVLTPEMIRIGYSEKGMFEDRPTFTVVNRNLELVDFKKKEDDRFLYIQTLSQKYSAFEIFVKRISQFTNFII